MILKSMIALALCAMLSSTAADDLTGLWKAQRRFDPDARGPLILSKAQGQWSADFLGRRFAVHSDDTELRFDAGLRAGSFLGYVEKGGNTVNGYWTFPRSSTNGFFFAVPVALKADGHGQLRGIVEPRDDAFRIYLMVQKRADGSLGAFIRNPERNIGGANYPVERLDRDGNAVTLIGKARGETQEKALLRGTYNPDDKVLSLDITDYGGTYDFMRDDDEVSDFYPRGSNPGRYAYQPPPQRDDGWPVGTLDAANISQAGLEKFAQMILDMPMDSTAQPEVEGVLIARHGKLVFEEYFHGEYRDKLHDTRSATKSLTATVVGAAMQAGAPLKLSSPVYQVMNGGTFPPNLEPRKHAMTLEHLMMMRSGYFCDDSNRNAPGNENGMTDQTEEPDFYRFTLKVPMAYAPDETSIYCSASPNLALGMVGRATGESPMRIFDRLLGAPLNIHRYAWLMDPAGHPYGGGSMQLLPRDFMKIGQLMLNGGTWNGKRILSADFVKRASSPLHDLNNIKYGYLWWGIDFPYKDRTVHAFFAGGNGGQGIIVIPELDMVVAIYGGSYATRVGLEIQQGFTPRYILPSVREAGDDRNAPVAWRDFAVTYGLKKP